MRIAQVATAASPVRQVGSDSIESIVWLLGRELTARGHDVTTFAVAGSSVHGELIETLPGPYAKGGAPGDWQLCEWLAVSRGIAEAHRFDVVHSHNYLYGLPMEPMSLAPLVHSLHVTPYEDAAKLWRRFPNARVTACSAFQWSAFPDLRPAAIIPAAVDETQFSFRAEPDDYLLYLGRFTPGKGPVEAIRVARRLGARLVLAGPVNDYFNGEVKPHLGDGVEYAGTVSGARRAELLAGARAMLYPVQAPEPFGLVMVESMLSGTPVVALNRGAVPEVIEQGVGGIWCDSIADMPRAVAAAAMLDRQGVRASALRRFSPARMAAQFEAVYESAVRGERPGTPSPPSPPPQLDSIPATPAGATA